MGGAPIRVAVVLSLVTSVLAGCLVAPSASPRPSASVPPATGIRGTVLLGPTCPVATADQPCLTPFAAELVILDRASVEVARVMSGTDGIFEIALEPGDYIVAPTPGDPFPTAHPLAVSVVVGSFTVIEVNYDSGIR